MPIELERALKKAAKKHGFTGERADAYIYGSLNKYKHGKLGKKKGKKSKLKIKGKGAR